MNHSSFLNRYQEIIDDVSALESSLCTPFRRSIIANRMRIDSKQLAALLKVDGYGAEPLPWMLEGLRLPNEGPGLGRHWTYRAGLFNIQEASAMLPAHILAPQPGERVLDLCAAPGNKTAQLGMTMLNTGTVIANDPDYRRLRPVRMMIDRLGLVNISTTCWDGTNYPQVAGRFDRVLVDAPCSCEGTFQKNPKVSTCHTMQREKFARKQRALLQRAIKLCRPGGRIVYSTCTLAPEENEEVVQAVLSGWPGRLRVLPVQLSDLNTSPGIATWAGRTFFPELQYCVRIWPHHNGTDGFFIALLEKTGRHLTDADDRPTLDHTSTDGLWPQTTQNPVIDPREYFQYLKIRFGIAMEIFENLQLLIKKHREIYVVTKDYSPPLKPIPSMGLPLMHINSRFFKLTTEGAMAFGSHASRNVIDVLPKQLNAYLSRQEIAPSQRQVFRCTGNGHVLIRYKGYVFGVGFYRSESSTVESFYPKAMAL